MKPCTSVLSPEQGTAPRPRHRPIPTGTRGRPCPGLRAHGALPVPGLTAAAPSPPSSPARPPSLFAARLSPLDASGTDADAAEGCAPGPRFRHRAAGAGARPCSGALESSPDTPRASPDTPRQRGAGRGRGPAGRAGAGGAQRPPLTAASRPGGDGSRARGRRSRAAPWPAAASWGCCWPSPRCWAQVGRPGGAGPGRAGRGGKGGPGARARGRGELCA